MSKREQLIKAGMKLFVKQGFENTPTSQISKEAGVATGTLFHHFNTKEELINEIYRYIKKSMSDALFADLDETSSVKNQIKNTWINAIKWGFEKKTQNMFLTRFYESTYISNLTVNEMKSLFKPGFETFKKGVKNKDIKNISSDLYGNITMGLLQSFLAEFYGKGKLDKKLLEQSFEVYWDAIRK